MFNKTNLNNNEDIYSSFYNKIKKLDEARKKISFYNLSSSTGREYCSNREIKNLEKKNARNQKKYDEYTALMKEMIVFLKNSGYKIDEIVDEFKILIPEDKTIDER